MTGRRSLITDKQKEKRQQMAVRKKLLNSFADSIQKEWRQMSRKKALMLARKGLDHNIAEQKQIALDIASGKRLPIRK